MDYSLPCDNIKKWFLPSQENNYTPGFLDSKVLFYGAILLLAVKIAFVAVSLNVQQNIFFADISGNALIQMVNQERSVIGLKPLTENKKLDQAALLKAQDMISNGYFSHQSPAGVTPWFWFGKTGYNYKYAGENLAIGFDESLDVYNAWFNSDSHRENFLSANYSEVGTAVVNGNFQGSPVTVVVQLFGKQKPITSQATNKPVSPTKPVVQTKPEINTSEKVVTNPTEKVLSAQDNALQISEQSAASKIANSVFYDYNDLFGKAIYILFLILSTISVLNIIIYYNHQNRKLVFKSLVLVLLLGAGTFIDKIPWKTI